VGPTGQREGERKGSLGLALKRGNGPAWPMRGKGQRREETRGGKEEGEGSGPAERRFGAGLSFPFLLSFFFSTLKLSNHSI
jgi:hypothetical protein